MKQLARLFALLLAAACKDATGAAGRVDPPAQVHVVNLTRTYFQDWTVIIGPDSQHTGLAMQGTTDTLGAPRSALCLGSGQVNGERLFVEAAVVARSPLDSFLTLRSDAGHARDVWADSLAHHTLDPHVMLTRMAGLVAATDTFDPAPPGFAFPPDTVFWRWTVDTGGVTSIVVDTTDHTCRP